MNEVRDDPVRERYVITADGEPAGFLQYNVRGGRVILVHTEITERFGGRGLGRALVRGALEDLRVRAQSIVPLCPFVERYIREHPEYDDLVDHELFAAINAERRAAS